MTKTQVWSVAGSSQAVAPVTAGAFVRGLTDLSHANASACLVACSRIAKLVPRQQVPALELVSSADSVPGWGWDTAVGSDELEFANQADE